jgi:DNA polymerase-4
MQRRARGEDDRPVHSERGRAKSISQEWTFSRDVSDPELLQAQVRQMAAQVAASLQKRKLVAHTVRVKFRWANFTTFTRQKSIEMGTDNADAICRLALTIWEENWPKGQRMRLIGVGVTNLEEPQGKQLAFDF